MRNEDWKPGYLQIDRARRETGGVGFLKSYAKIRYLRNFFVVKSHMALALQY